MRDGVRLQTVVFTPKDQSVPLPILFTRGPYGVPDECCPAGTDDIVVFQNLRGRFKSEGEFVMQRPPRDRSDGKAVDESSDAYDTIDWLVKNLPNNNRRVGMFGVSYLGWTVVMALVGAACGFAGAYFTGSTFLGALLGVVAGISMAAVFGVLTLGLAVNQVATGLALTILGGTLGARHKFSFLGSLSWVCGWSCGRPARGALCAIPSLS